MCYFVGTTSPSAVTGSERCWKDITWSVVGEEIWCYAHLIQRSSTRDDHSENQEEDWT